MRRVVVIGGGIAGLAAALNLKDGAEAVADGLEVTLLEAEPRAGGNIRSENNDGFLVEWGPNGYLDNVPAMSRLVERLGLREEVRQADPRAARRFLYRGGRLHLLPSGPLGFLRSPVLSVGGRLRVLLEPFARSRPEGVDETIFEFASRRIGREAAEILVDAMVSGVFAGDARQLSLESTFPKMAAMEAAHGSLVRAMLARGRERRAARQRLRELGEDDAEAAELTRPGGPAGPGGTLTSFDGGLERLVERLVDELREEVRLGERVASLEPAGEGAQAGGRRWRITCDGGEVLEADAVVVASPASSAARMVRGADGQLAEELEGIRSAGLAVVALGYEAAAIGGPPAGFGFLAPRGQGLRLLGCLWDSSIFPNRAPAGRVLLRAMMGGTHDPEAVELPEEELLAIARRELGQAMGLAAEPILASVIRHPAGIAQYERGHQARLDRIAERLRASPGLWLSGSSFHGVSMNSCVERAEQVSEDVRGYLTTGRSVAVGVVS